MKNALFPFVLLSTLLMPALSGCAEQGKEIEISRPEEPETIYSLSREEAMQTISATCLPRTLRSWPSSLILDNYRMEKRNVKKAEESGLYELPAESSGSTRILFNRDQQWLRQCSRFAIDGKETDLDIVLTNSLSKGTLYDVGEKAYCQLSDSFPIDDQSSYLRFLKDTHPQTLEKLASLDLVASLDLINACHVPNDKVAFPMFTLSYINNLIQDEAVEIENLAERYLFNGSHSDFVVDVEGTAKGEGFENSFSFYCVYVDSLPVYLEKRGPFTKQAFLAGVSEESVSITKFHYQDVKPDLIPNDADYSLWEAK